MPQRTPTTFGAIEALHDRFVATMTAPEVWALLMRSAAVHCLRGPVNVMMITAQRPSATDIRTRSEWATLGHQVRQGEPAICIFALPEPSRFGAERVDQPWRPDAQPLVAADRAREYRTPIQAYTVAEMFDVSQTSAAHDEQYRRMRQRLAAPALPVDFVERRAVYELQTLGAADVDTSVEPDEQSALTRLQDLARAWVQEDRECPTPEDQEALALSAAHVVARMAGMRNTGPVPVPRLTGDPVEGGNSRIKVAATYVIRTAHSISDLITEQCPCCGELIDQCVQVT